MPENIGSSEALYNTKIPRIVENADIQTALRLYHYGENTNNPGTVISDSIAGHLNFLQNNKVDITPIVLQNNVNLDSLTTTGYYNQPSVSNARSGQNYPEYPDIEGDLRFYPGLLKVVNDGGIVFQEYHMAGEVGYTINTAFWRVLYANAWSSWKGLLDSDDILEITDIVYHRKSVTYTRAEMDNRYSPRLFVESPARTSNYTIVLEDINRVVRMSISAAGTLTIPANATTAFPLGSVINIYNTSSNLLTIAGASGVTLRNGGRLEQFKEASIRKRDTNEWVAAGPLY